MKKLTPVILVNEIEPCLAFWTDRLGRLQHLLERMDR